MAWSLFGKDAAKCIEEGNAALDQGEWQQAVEHFSAAIEKEPDSLDAHLMRGRAERELGQFEQALADLNRCVELDGENTELRRERANLHCHLGNYSEALADYDQAVVASPAADLLVSRAIVHQTLGDFEKCVADCRQALQVHPAETDAWLLLAECQESLGDWENAAQSYGSLLQADAARGPLARFRRGRALAHLQQFDAAQADLDAAASALPNDLDLCVARAYVYEMLGEKEQAEAERKRFAELHAPTLQGLIEGGGVKLRGVLLFADPAIYEPGPDNRIGTALVTFEPPTDLQTSELRALTKQIFSLAEQGGTSEDEQLAASIVNAPTGIPYTRTALPNSIGGWPVVYAMEMVLYRPYFPDGVVATDLIPCVAEPGEEGVVELLPHWEDA